MKKIFLFCLLFLFSFENCYAIEEIVLPKNESDFPEYLSDVYYGKIEDVSPLLQIFSKNGLEFENSIINSIKIHFLYSEDMNYNMKEHSDKSFVHTFSTIEPMFSVNFNDDKSQFMFDINLTRNLDGYSNNFSQKITKLYMSHKVSPEQTFIIGQYQRLPNTNDGSKSLYAQEMISKSQMGRNLSNIFSTGIRNIGSYKYMNYDIGIYDSTRYMKDFGQGLDFTGAVYFKPFSDFNEELGNLKIGGAYNLGDYHISYHMYSAFLDYQYKKIHARIEYANADGYNGIKESQNSAEAFYTYLGYDLTEKLKIQARYDVFNPNTKIHYNTQTEYTAGISYQLFKNWKLMLNYVRVNNQSGADSNRLLFATRFFI